MLGIATVATMATSPGQTFLVSQFYTSFQTEMRLDSTVGLAAAYMYGTLGAGLLMPLVGALSDRFGTRVMMGIAAAGLAFSCVLIGYAQNLLQLGFAFFCLRVFGQGALSLVSSHTIAMWFEKRLGIAESIRHTGMSIANVVLPPLAIAAIALFGWKAAYGLLGLAVYLAVIPPVLLLFRNKPEDIGQRVDHARAPAPVDRTIDDLEPDSITDLSRDPHTPPTPELLEPYFTPRQAIRTGAYWIVTGALVANASIFTAVALEHQVIVREAGCTRSGPSRLRCVVGTVVCSLVGGQNRGGSMSFRSRCVRRRLPLGPLESGWRCVSASRFMDALLILRSQLRYFGRRHHGAIRGTLTRSMIVGTAVGPAGLSFFAEQVGGYRVPMLVCAAITIPLTIASLSMRRPDEPDHDTTAI